MDLRGQTRRPGRPSYRGLLVAALALLTAAPPAAHGGPTPGPVAEQATKRNKAPVYCTARKKPKGCITVAKRDQRPPAIDQQGPSTLTLPGAEDGGGVGGGPRDTAAGEVPFGHAAVQWAFELRGNSQWQWRCERLVEEAYGTRGQFASAAQAETKLQLHREPVTSAPRGALVYFGKDRYNHGYGHVGLSLGKGKVISALDTVRVIDVTRSRYWSSIYRGWATPPTSWPGRIPPPVRTIDSFAENALVKITAPASGTVASGGSYPLYATATDNVSGVAFEGYYADSPQDAATLRWHPLGQGKLIDGSWQQSIDTTTIPNQANTAWGTVTIAAVALDARGRSTGVRDFRRIAVNNPAPAAPPIVTTPTPVPTPITTDTTPTTGPQTWSETPGGYANTWSDYTSASGNQGPDLPPHQRVEVSCRVEGLRVPDGNTWWYRLASAAYLGYYVTADAFYNNGATSGSLAGTPFFDPAVPICAPPVTR